MFVVLVHIRVKPEAVEAFKAATLENARGSRKEPGIARFEVLQDHEHPDRFVLMEAFRSEEAPALHKETEHYRQWREKVEGMMAEPRQGRRYADVSIDG